MVKEAILNGTPIHKATEPDMRQTLLYCMALLGLTPDQTAKEMERDLIIVNLRKKYPAIKVEEMRIAFEMYCNGDLRYDGGLFGKKFNYKFVSSILKSYIEQERNVVLTEMNQALNKPKEPTEDEKKAAVRLFIEKCIIPPLREFEAGKSLDFGLLDINRVYKLFKDAGIVSVGKAKAQVLGNKYRSEVRAEWANKLDKPATTKDQHLFKKKIEEALKDEQTGDFASEVVRRCKLHILTETIKAKDINNIINQLKTE